MRKLFLNCSFGLVSIVDTCWLSTRSQRLHTINPYEPKLLSQPVGPEPIDTPLMFAGVVDEADYRRLMPLTRLASLLQVLFALTSLIFVVVVGSILWITIYRPGPGPVPLLPIVGSIVMLVACAVAPWYVISPPRRTRRALSKHPDLTGHFRGSLSPCGLCFCDRDGTAWITPTAVAMSKINRFGIRVPIGPDPYRFLPLPLRIFDGANAEDLKVVKRSCLQTAEGLNSGESYRRVASVVFGRPHAETVYGSGQLTLTAPLSRPEKLAALTSLAFYVLILIWGGVAVLEHWNVWLATFAIIIVGCCMATGVRQVMKQWSGGKQTQTFQWVAIDTDQWVIGNVWLAQIFSTHHFLSITWHDEFVTATLPGERTVFVFKSMLEGEQNAAWQRLRQIMAAVTS